MSNIEDERDKFFVMGMKAFRMNEDFVKCESLEPRLLSKDDAMTAWEVGYTNAMILQNFYEDKHS